jgi:hypothetical protein
MSRDFSPYWRRLQRSGFDWRRVEQGFGSKLVNYQITHLPNSCRQDRGKMDNLWSFSFQRAITVKFTLGRFRSIAIFFAISMANKVMSFATLCLTQVHVFGTWKGQFIRPATSTITATLRNAWSAKVRAFRQISGHFFRSPDRGRIAAFRCRCPASRTYRCRRARGSDQRSASDKGS